MLYSKEKYNEIIFFLYFENALLTRLRRPWHCDEGDEEGEEEAGGGGHHHGLQSHLDRVACAVAAGMEMEE